MIFKDGEDDKQTEVNPFEGENVPPPPTTETNKVSKEFTNRKKD